MSLSAAFNIINSAFVANAAQSAVISSNISNAGTKGYAREIANLVTIASGGVEVASVGREANAALLEQVNTSTSQAAYQQALSDGLTTLAQYGERQFVGDLDIRRRGERQFARRRCSPTCRARSRPTTPRRPAPLRRKGW